MKIKWKNGDKNIDGYLHDLFMDLSKVFDTVNHDPILVKLRAYCFSSNALKL